MTENRRYILKLKELIKQKKFVIGVPIIINFKLKGLKEYKNWKATKGTEVVKWKDILKAFKEIK